MSTTSSNPPPLYHCPICQQTVPSQEAVSLRANTTHLDCAHSIVMFVHAHCLPISCITCHPPPTIPIQQGLSLDSTPVYRDCFSH